MSTRTTAPPPAPRVRSLEEKIGTALRTSQLWQISPVHASYLLAEVLAPRVVDHAEGRTGQEVDEAGCTYIETELRVRLEAWFKARVVEREEQIRRDLDAGERYVGRQSQVYELTQQVLEQFVPNGNSD